MWWRITLNFDQYPALSTPIKESGYRVVLSSLRYLNVLNPLMFNCLLFVVLLQIPKNDLGIKTPTHTTNRSLDAPVRTGPVLQYVLFISRSISHVRGIRYNGTRTLHLSSSHPHPTTQLSSMNVAHFSPTQALYWWIKRHRNWIIDCIYFPRAR